MYPAAEHNWSVVVHAPYPESGDLEMLLRGVHYEMLTLKVEGRTKNASF